MTNETALTPADFANFERSGISPDMAVQACRRVNSREGAALIGRNGRSSGDCAGIAFPYIWPGDSHPRDYNLRLDHPTRKPDGKGGSKIDQKYLRRARSPNQLYFAPGVLPEYLSDVQLPIIITEGEKKTLALQELAGHGLNKSDERPRFLAIGLSGVWNWRGRSLGPDGKPQKPTRPIPDLDQITWARRPTMIVFDANVRTNTKVQQARSEFRTELAQARRARVHFFAWPKSIPPDVNGIDDLIGAWGPDRVPNSLQMPEAADATSSESAAEPEPHTSPFETAERAALQQVTPYQIARKKLGARLMADIQPETVEWLWRRRIPLGKVTLMDGDPGLGKSYITLAIATAVSRGYGLPGEEKTTPGRVVLMSAEDGLGDTVRPRLDRMGADNDMILALSEPITLDPAGCKDIDDLLEVEKPRLVIIDTLFAYTGANVDIHKANETRAIMARLKRLAERHGCAILCIRHITKSGRDKSIYRGIGSIDWAAACRSILLVGADAQDRNRRAIVQVKNNLSLWAEPIGYSIDNEGVFAWTGISDLTANQILASDDAPRASLSLEDAVEFLRELLTSGPTSQNDVKAAAKRAGISERTLYRAKADLQVRSIKTGFGDAWVWSLPEAS